MNKTYTFIFEIIYRDLDTGQYKPAEYRKIRDLTIAGARLYCRRYLNMTNVVYVKFFKEMM